MRSFHDLFIKGALLSLFVLFLTVSVKASGDKITFISEPPTTGAVEQSYEYNVTATSESGATIKYFLRYGPQGSVIDKNTGKLTWIPNSAGEFEIKIFATTNEEDFDDYGAAQTWKVKVVKCQTLSKIYGTVTDKDGAPYSPGYVTISKIPSDYPFSKSAIVNGNYEFIDLDEGKYRLAVFFDSPNGSDSEVKTYSYSVSCGENKKIDFQIKPPDFNNQIRIISEPSEIATVGKEYVYVVEAEAKNKEMKIKYRLGPTPIGLPPKSEVTLDENTGELKWIPDTIGVYTFQVYAWAEENDFDFYLNDTQNWMVIVTSCDEPGKIKTKVNVDDGVEMHPFQLVLYKTPPDDPSFDESNFSYNEFCMEDEDGNYAIDKIESGVYYLCIFGHSPLGDEPDPGCLYRYWYESSFSGDAATPIEIVCGETKNITVNVRPQEPYYYKVSGRVVDENGAPLKNIYVALIYDNSYIGMPVQYWNADLGGDKTNADGYYSFYAPANVPSIARADMMLIPPPQTDSIARMVYYNQTTDPTKADTFKLSSNRENINFMIPKYVPFQNSLSGKIQYENDAPAEEGTDVMLWFIEPTQNYAEWKNHVYNTQTSATGDYKFECLMPGKYILYSSPKNTVDYYGGYYRAGEELTEVWSEATHIEVQENSSIVDVNMKYLKFKGIVGGGEIKGHVYGKNKKQIVKGDGDLNDGLPMYKANVYAFNSDGKVAGYALTDKKGAFRISKLSPGTYSLKIDYFGFEVGLATVDLQGDIANAEIELPIKAIYEKPELSGLKIFPNPASENLRLDFQAEGATRISLVNSLGVKVYSKELGVLSGASTHSIDLGSLPQGSYYVIVESGARASALPVIIIK